MTVAWTMVAAVRFWYIPKLELVDFADGDEDMVGKEGARRERLQLGVVFCKKNSLSWGVWVAQLVKHLTCGFSHES